MGAECKPLTMGGDHFVTYPILRAIAEKHGPVRSNGSRVYLYHLPLEAYYEKSVIRKTNGRPSGLIKIS